MLIGGWGKQMPASGKPGTTPGSSTVGGGGGWANKQNNKSPTEAHSFFMLEIVLTQVSHQQIIATFTTFWSKNRTLRGAAVSGLARADHSQH